MEVPFNVLDKPTGLDQSLTIRGSYDTPLPHSSSQGRPYRPQSRHSLHLWGFANGPARSYNCKIEWSFPSENGENEDRGIEGLEDALEGLGGVLDLADLGGLEVRERGVGEKGLLDGLRELIRRILEGREGQEELAFGSCEEVNSALVEPTGEVKNDGVRDEASCKE